MLSRHQPEAQTGPPRSRPPFPVCRSKSASAKGRIAPEENDPNGPPCIQRLSGNAPAAAAFPEPVYIHSLSVLFRCARTAAWAPSVNPRFTPVLSSVRVSRSFSMPPCLRCFFTMAADRLNRTDSGAEDSFHRDYGSILIFCFQQGISGYSVTIKEASDIKNGSVTKTGGRALYGPVRTLPIHFFFSFSAHYTYRLIPADRDASHG